MTAKTKRWWISWYQPTDDERPLTYPPNAAIIGWWNSGSSDEAWTLCAVVDAISEAAARKAVLKDWPEASNWRFCEPRIPTWRPNDRFPIDGWAKQRFDGPKRL